MRIKVTKGNNPNNFYLSENEQDRPCKIDFRAKEFQSGNHILQGAVWVNLKS